MATVLIAPGASAPTAPETRHASGQGIFARMAAAFICARQEQADRQVAEILARRGGLMAPARTKSRR